MLYHVKALETVHHGYIAHEIPETLIDHGKYFSCKKKKYNVI